MISRHLVASALCSTMLLTTVPTHTALAEGGHFVDDDSSVHEDSIDALAAAGVTRGCNPPNNDRFCPQRTVTRGEMATLIVRAHDMELVGENVFGDTSDTVHETAINALAAAGVVNGCNPPDNDRFCPGQGLTRAQAATILAGAGDLSPEGGGRFVDVGDGVHAGSINAVAAAGLVKACNPPSNDRFCPHRLVTRAELATMLSRQMGLTAPATPPPPPPSGSFPGRPGSDQVLWGASLAGNSDPYPAHEQPTGEVLTVRRTFFDWAHIGGGWLTSILEDDHAAGRLPWISFKPPGCSGTGCSAWEEVASGEHDAKLDALLLHLESLSEPVWLTMHHEPEGGDGGEPYPDDPGGPVWHVEMNRHVRQRMEALGVDNVALGLIVMGWTFDPRAIPDPDVWWAGDVYDFLGVDTYAEDGVSIVSRGYWGSLRRWADAKGVDVAVAEWGMRGTDAAAGERVREWFEHAAASRGDGLGARVVALAAYDSARNAPAGSWELQGEQRRVFHALMGDPRVATP